MMIRAALAALMLTLCSQGAWAACTSSPASIQDVTGSVRNYDLSQGTAGNCINQQFIVQMPASAALADATANPTTTGIAAYNFGFNGTTWDRLKTKPASSPAAATDTSMVVQLNPIQPNLASPLNVAITQIGSTAVVGDPCQVQTPSFTPISITAASSVQIVTGTAAKKIYVCSLVLATGVADNVAVVEGTGTACATGIAGVIGGTTAANGLNFAANGGMTFGSGLAAIAATATAADNLCLITSSAGPLAGHVKWVQQ